MAGRSDGEAGTVPAGSARRIESPELTAARDILTTKADKTIPIKHDDGTVQQVSAAEALNLADEEAAFAEQADTAVYAAISCSLRFGDKV